MRRKKSEPLGSSIRCERGLSRSVSTRSPSLYHSTVGVGRPSALQLRVAGSPLETIRSEGCSTIRGGESSWRRRDPGGEKKRSLASRQCDMFNSKAFSNNRISIRCNILKAGKRQINKKLTEEKSDFTSIPAGEGPGITQTPCG